LELNFYVAALAELDQVRLAIGVDWQRRRFRTYCQDCGFPVSQQSHVESAGCCCFGCRRMSP
jgi:hypothetical protein